MKKILKGCLSIAIVICVAFSFCACKPNISKTTVDTSNVKSVSGVSTNDGMTVVYEDYLYFVNGMKDKDGTNLKGNKKSAICRIAYNTETGKTTGEAEVVVDNLVGFKNGSINFFGDFMYFTTPCSDKNYEGTVLHNKLSFVRYDLVNKNSYTIYTTHLNDESEEISYAYYVVGDSLNLVVYEKTNKTITSLNIADEIKVNYVIDKVDSCLLSENNGKCVTAGATVDANSFVYFTTAPDSYDYPQTGAKVYKVSPVTNNKVLISEGESITLMSIRCGKLLFAARGNVYISNITANQDTLACSNLNCVSYADYDNVIYLENYKIEGEGDSAKLVEKAGSIVVLYFDTESKKFVMFTWNENLENKLEIITVLDTVGSFKFIGTTKIEEIVKEDDETTTDVNEEETRTVMYAVYTNSNLVYKIEIAVVDKDHTGELKLSQKTSPIKLSESTLKEETGLLVPEIIGNYLFAMCDKDEKTYMYQIDLTPTKPVAEEATKIGIDE